MKYLQLHVVLQWAAHPLDVNSSLYMKHNADPVTSILFRCLEEQRAYEKQHC